MWKKLWFSFETKTHFKHGSAFKLPFRNVAISLTGLFCQLISTE